MDQFDLQFDSYINTIIEVLLRRVLHQNHSKDATTIRGRSIEDLKDLIRAALLEHLTDKKAHGLSYKDIGGMSRSSILGRFGNMQSSTLIPISVVENLTSKITANWTDRRFEIASFNYIHNGLEYTYPGGSVPLIHDGVSYLVLRPVSSSSSLGVITNDSDGNVVPKAIHFGYVNQATKNLSCIKIVRIGANHFSTVASGGGIAVSKGVVHKPDSLDAGWK